MQSAPEHPFTDLQPAQTLDCRGMPCPAPILELSKAARNYGKQVTVIELIADDAEFPNDLRAWCRASKNTLINLLEDDGLFVAHVGLNIRGEERAPSSGPRTVAHGQKVSALQASRDEVRTSIDLPSVPSSRGQQAIHRLDCRGMSSPTPILAVAKKAQLLARQTAILEILATDPQFPTDLEAWCRASKAQLASVERIEGEIRAIVALGDVPSDAIAQVAAPVAREPARSGASVALLPPMPPPVAAPRSAPTLVALSGAQRAELSRDVTNVGAMGAVAPANDVSPPLAPRENRCTLLINKNDVGSFVAAMDYASMAAAAGMEANVFLSFGAVHLLRLLTLQGTHEGSVSRFLARRRKRNLYEWLTSSEQRRVRLVVCTGSLRDEGLTAQDITALPNVQFAEGAIFVDLSRRSAMTMVF